MARGIIYCMDTVVDGLVKIGKSGIDNFKQRMSSLERNGYAQIGGLKKRFAIEVDNYDEKEKIMHKIFEAGRVKNTELFSADADFVVQILSSFEGRQVYPETISKEEIFNIATDEIQENTSDTNKYVIPNGEYYISEKVRKYGTVKATMKVEDDKFIVLKGSKCLPTNKDWLPEQRRTAKIQDGILMEDVECKSPSTAGWVVLGNSNNGWVTWKTKEGHPIDVFRKISE